MNDSIKSLQGFIMILPSIFIFVYIMVKKPKTRKQKIREIAIANNWVVIADAVKYYYRSADDRRSDHDYWYVTYEYVIDGVKRKKKISFIADGRSDFPHNMEVYYLKNNPRRVVFEEDIDHLTTYKYGCLCSFIVFVVFGLLIGIVLNTFFK